MSRKATKRRHYDPMGYINKRLPLSTDQQTDLGIAYHASLQGLLTGHGTEQAWSTVACALNVSLLLAECGICAPAIQTIKLAQEALMRSHERAQRTSKWALDGDGIRVIQAALNIHDEQNSRATKGQITEAMREVHRRVEQGEVFA